MSTNHLTDIAHSAKLCSEEVLSTSPKDVL